MTLPRIDMEFPAFDSDQLQAGGRGEPDAVEAVGEALFALWPVPPAGTADEGDTDTLVGSVLGQYVRALFPFELDDAVVAAALARIAGQLQKRILKRWKPDRGSFADWCRLNVEDLATQEAVAAYQRYGEAVREILGPVDEDLAGEPNRWREALEAGDVPGAVEVWTRWEPIRLAVCGLVWQSYFFADPDLHGEGLQLSIAGSWIVNLMRRAGLDPHLADCEDLAQRFYLGKVLEKDLLLRFRTELGSSFIQWLRISVENYTRDELSRAPTPEETSFSDALAGSLASGGTVVSRREGKSGEGDDDPAAMAHQSMASGATGGDELDAAMNVALPDAGFGAEGGDRLTVLLHDIMPALLAEPAQRTIARLTMGLPLIREDVELLARQRMVQWAAGLAASTFGRNEASSSDVDAMIPDIDPDDPVAAVPGMDTLRDRFDTHCRQLGIAAASRTSDRLPKSLTAPQRDQVRDWFAHQLSPLIQSGGGRPRAPELPAGVRTGAGRIRLDDTLEQLQKVLMAIEHAPPLSGQTSVYEALVDALGRLVESIERDRSADEKEFNADTLGAISKNRLRIQRYEARLRNLDPDSDDAKEVRRKLERLQRSNRTKAHDLNRKTFVPKDADIARLFGVEAKAVSSIKSRVKKNLADFHQADHLSRLRRDVSVKLKARGKKAMLARYESALEGLATFSMFPANAAARRGLAGATDGRLTDDVANELQGLLAVVRGRRPVGAAEREKAAAQLDRLQADLLGRSALTDAGAPEADVRQWEDEALRIFPALIWLRQVQAADA